jgi:hypothetical protein
MAQIPESNREDVADRFPRSDGRETQIDLAQAVLAAPQQRAQKHRKEDLEKLKQKWRSRQPATASGLSAQCRRRESLGRSS